MTINEGHDWIEGVIADAVSKVPGTPGEISEKMKAQLKQCLCTRELTAAKRHEFAESLLSELTPTGPEADRSE